MGVDQLVGRRRDVGQDTQPGVGVLAFPDGQQARRHRRPADPVEAVAAGDRVAGHLAPGPVRAGVPERRAGRVQVAHLGAGHVELQVAAGGQPGLDEVLHHLGLRVDGDRPPGQVTEVDVMPPAGELEVDPAVLQALAVQAAGQARVPEQRDAAVLQHAGPLAGLAVLPAPVFDQHGVDATQREQMGQQEAGRPGPDDSDLGARARGCGGHLERVGSDLAAHRDPPGIRERVEVGGAAEPGAGA